MDFKRCLRVLNRLDKHLESLINEARKRNLLFDPKTPITTTEMDIDTSNDFGYSLLKSILKFSSILLQNGYNKEVYNSTEVCNISILHIAYISLSSVVI